MDTREGRACRVRTPSASVPPSDATSASLPFRTPPSLGQHNEIRRDFTEMCVTQFLKSSVPLCLRALRVDRPEAQGCLPAPRAEAARVHRVPRVCGARPLGGAQLVATVVGQWGQHVDCGKLRGL